MNKFFIGILLCNSVIQPAICMKWDPMKPMIKCMMDSPEIFDYLNSEKFKRFGYFDGMSKNNFFEENENMFPIHIAIKDNMIETVKFLIDELKKTKLNKQAILNSLFHFSAYLGKTEAASLILSEGATIDYKLNKQTALVKALEQGHSELAMMLIDKGADIDIADAEGKTPIEIAKEKKDLQLISTLFMKKGNELKIKGVSNEEIVENLSFYLGMDFDPSMKGKMGETLFHHIAGKGDLHCFGSLLQRYSNFNYFDNNGLTPTDIALLNKKFDLSIVLLEKYGKYSEKILIENIDKVDEMGVTLTQHAESHNAKKATQILKSLKTNHFLNTAPIPKNPVTPNTQNISLDLNSYGYSILHKCLLNRNYKEAFNIIFNNENKNLINDCNNDHMLSPIHIAVILGHEDIVNFLIAMGADVNVCDDQGFTPLMYARNKKHYGIEQSLLENGAKEYN